jgi:predicted nucleic acid-binding protein
VILFCDTSALLKLFIDEEGSDVMLRERSDRTGIAVCRITWAESMAAFAQRGRVKGANQAGLTQARSMFAQTWPDFAIALSGYDSVQLAAAHNLHEQFDLPLTFACFDRRLNQAAPSASEMDHLD